LFLINKEIYCFLFTIYFYINNRIISILKFVVYIEFFWIFSTRINLVIQYIYCWWLWFSIKIPNFVFFWFINKTYILYSTEKNLNKKQNKTKQKQNKKKKNSSNFFWLFLVFFKIKT
jgi:hypothetical protein